MPVLSSAQLASMAKTVRTTLLDQTATISRTSVTVPARLMPNGTVPFGGDARLAPLTRYHLTLPVGTDLRAGDHVSIVGMGTFLVLQMGEPMSYDVVTQADVMQLYDPATGAVGLTSASVTVFRVGIQVLTGVPVHIEPFDSRPFLLMQNPDNAAGQTIYDSYTLFTLAQPVPDIRLRDEITDPGETDHLTGSAARYYVKRVKAWPGSHLELECDRVATKPTL